MNLKLPALAAAAIVSLPMGIYYTAGASSTSAAIQQGLPVKSPTFSISEGVAVGLVGSAVTRRLIEKGKETILIDEKVDRDNTVDLIQYSSD